MSATVALASSTLARPVQTVLHHALCYTRDVSSVSDQHRRVRWCRTRTRFGLCSTSSTDYTLPRLRIKFAEHAWSYAGPSAWNGLPEVSRAVADTVEFRKQLKTQYFTAAQNVYWYFSSCILCFYDCCNAPMFIFTALHVMQTRYCDEISVRLSVCLPVCLSVCLSVCLTVRPSVWLSVRLSHG